MSCYCLTHLHICHIIQRRLVSADIVSEFMFYSHGVCLPPIAQTGQDVLWIAKHGHAINHRQLNPHARKYTHRQKLNSLTRVPTKSCQYSEI